MAVGRGWSCLILSLFNGGVGSETSTNITLNSQSFDLKHELGFQEKKINELSAGEAQGQIFRWLHMNRHSTKVYRCHFHH